MTTSFSEGVESYIEADRALINTAIPAKILTYNPSTQKCTVVPLIDILLKDGRRIVNPTLEDVPVIFPSSSNSLISFPLTVGDTVLLIFSQRSLDTWLSSPNSDPVDPGDFRKHDYTDAIAIPGLSSFPRAVNDPKKHTLVHDTDDLVITHNLGTAAENEIRLKEDGTIRIGAGENTKLTLNLDGSVVLDAPTSLEVNSPTTTWNGDINQAGTFTSDTDVVAAGISLKTHTHGGVTTGGGSTGAPA